MIGVAVPIYDYNSCPLKHEVINLLMSGELLCHEDPRCSNWKVTYNKIQYNTSSSYYFHDLSEVGIPMLSFYKFIFMYMEQITICGCRLVILYM